MAAESSPRLAGVLVLTTMGRVLLQCERDAAVPFHVPKLALLLASLLQFATPRQDFARLQSKNGYCVVLSVDAAASVACAVIFRSGSALDERARLLSLVVLREFLARFQESVEHVVEQNHVDAEQMAEAYTLTRALDGETRSEDDDGGEGTMDMFLGFHDDVVMRLLEAPDALTPEGTNGKQGPVDVLHTNIVNAETGVLVTATHHRLEKTGEDAVAVVGSYACHQLVRRAARALQLAFPILYDTSLLQRRSNLTGHGQGLANASINATALVLRLTRAGPTSTNSYDVAIRMSHHGVFAVSIHYTHNDSSSGACFRGRDCELLRDVQLQRVLGADPRGAALARLIHDAETSTDFALHVGSDGMPLVIHEMTERAFCPWTLPLAVATSY